jgi:hypothetical protein
MCTATANRLLVDIKTPVRSKSTYLVCNNYSYNCDFVKVNRVDSEGYALRRQPGPAPVRPGGQAQIVTSGTHHWPNGGSLGEAGWSAFT